MSPAKIAIAAQVTIAPTAGTGSMKNVTGTSSAIAIVAVRPGMAPTRRPNIAATATVISDLPLEDEVEGLADGAHAVLPSRRYQGSRGMTPRGRGTRSMLRKT